MSFTREKRRKKSQLALSSFEFNASILSENEKQRQVRFEVPSSAGLNLEVHGGVWTRAEERVEWRTKMDILLAHHPSYLEQHLHSSR